MLDDKNLPPQKLALAISTADVVLLGWRLDFLADKHQENDLPPFAPSPNATPRLTATCPSSPPSPPSQSRPLPEGERGFSGLRGVDFRH